MTPNFYERLTSLTVHFNYQTLHQANKNGPTNLFHYIYILLFDQNRRQAIPAFLEGGQQESYNCVPREIWEDTSIQMEIILYENYYFQIAK